jgi:hypothetical protein
VVTSTGSATAQLERPFYFIVVLWGERFRDYFLEYCLASLLSPGNLPALNTTPRSKFLIATRPDDWAAMSASRIFGELKRYVDPVFIEIPPCPPDRTGCQHMGIGHSLACDMAHQAKAFATVLTPDCMLSDGSIAFLQQLARNGTELVLTAALRFGEEPFLGHLREAGLLNGGNRADAGVPLIITGRQMVRAAVNGFHSQTLAYEWDAPGIVAISPAAWWRVPGEDGIVLHSLSWAPLLLDYAAVDDHDTSTFGHWTLDGDYLFKNSAKMKKLYLVQDSDDLFLASWAPLADRPIKKTRFPFEKFMAGYFFQFSFNSNFFDPLKRTYFFRPVRWHSKALNDRWDAVERRAIGELRRFVVPPEEVASAVTQVAASPLNNLLFQVKRLGLSAMRLLIFAWIYRRSIVPFAVRIFRGDRAALQRIVWFLRSFVFGKAATSNP